MFSPKEQLASRRRAVSQYRGLFSKPMYDRPSSTAAIAVEPLPMNGSRITLAEVDAMARCGRSTGNVGISGIQEQVSWWILHTLPSPHPSRRWNLGLVIRYTTS